MSRSGSSELEELQPTCRKVSLFVLFRPSTYWITTNTLEDATFLSNATVFLKGFFLSRLKICSTKNSVGTASL